MENFNTTKVEEKKSHLEILADLKNGEHGLGTSEASNAIRAALEYNGSIGQSELLNLIGNEILESNDMVELDKLSYAMVVFDRAESEIGLRKVVEAGIAAGLRYEIASKALIKLQDADGLANMIQGYRDEGNNDTPDRILDDIKRAAGAYSQKPE